jgi:serine/threonine protein kinase
LPLRKNQRIGPYTVVEALPAGRGGFSQVVKARPTTGLGEEVALKVARLADADGSPGTTTYSESLQNEVDLLRRLRHRGIVRLVPIPLVRERPVYIARDLNLGGQPWYFAMEYLAGGTIEALVKRHGPLDPALVAEVGLQVSQALTYLHEQGMWHHDVKARNIMFRRPVQEGHLLEPVLGDFGVAQHQKIMASVEGGTIEYLSPERLSEINSGGGIRSEADPTKADIYALGVVLYYMVTGQMPFRGSRERITTAIRTLEPKPPLLLRKELAQDEWRPLNTLLLAMMAKDPAKRPAADEVGAQLQRLAQSHGEWHLQHNGRRQQAKRLAELPSRWQIPARRALLLGVTVFVLGVGTVWGAAALWPKGQPAEVVASPTETPTPPGVTIAAAQGGGVAKPGASPTVTPIPIKTSTPGPKITTATSRDPTATLAAAPTSVPTRPPATPVAIALLSPTLDEVVTMIPFVLRWQAPALGANEQFLVVLSGDGQQTESECQTASLTIEQWDAARFDKPFTWQVQRRAQGDAGAWIVTEQSAVGRFKVNPSQSLATVAQAPTSQTSSGEPATAAPAATAGPPATRPPDPPTAEPPPESYP